MFQRRARNKREETFEERLLQEAQRCKDEAGKIPNGRRRNLLLRRTWQAETASRMNEWL